MAARRGANGKPAPIALGSVTAPRGAPGALLVAEIARTDAGTLACAARWCRDIAFPPGSGTRRRAVSSRSATTDFVDTGYACRIERDTGAMVITGPPPGLVSVGGYRFALRDLQDLAAQIDPAARSPPCPTPSRGHRLAGNAGNRDAVRDALDLRGVNPLIARRLSRPPPGGTVERGVISSAPSA